MTINKQENTFDNQLNITNLIITNRKSYVCVMNHKNYYAMF